MAKYRKVDSRIWNDAKFRELSDDGKLMFFMLLTHPNMTALGAMRASLAGLADEIGWSPEGFRKAFREAQQKGMAEYDEKTCLIALPKFIKYNPPESPNVVKAWDSALDLLPECNLKTRVIAGARGFIEGKSKGFKEALPEAFAKGMPNQEQEPEQEQDSNTPPISPQGDQDQKPPPDDKPKKSNSRRTKLPDDFALTDERREAALNFWAGKGRHDLNPDEIFSQFLNHHRAHGKTMADWDAAWRTWYTNAVKFEPPNGGNHGSRQQPDKPRSPADRFRAIRAAEGRRDGPPVGADAGDLRPQVGEQLRDHPDRRLVHSTGGNHSGHD